MESSDVVVEAESPINIALVKYWGKVDDTRIIPTCSSLSITVNKKQLSSRTKVTLKDEDTQKISIHINLNGEAVEKIPDRISNVVAMIGKRIAQDSSKSHLLKKSISIESVNNFKTAAGMASSASGLSCLALTLAKAYGLEESFKGEFSQYARLGSGSACRSVYGGFVEWNRGFDGDLESYKELCHDKVSEQSIATRFEFEQEQFWLDNLRILICIVKPEDGQAEVKDIPSTHGMNLSKMTSDLFKYRCENNTA